MKEAGAALAALALVLSGMAALVAWPGLAGVFCAACAVAVLALVYVAGDERGFLAGTYLNFRLRERERSEREGAAPPARADWKNDGQ